MAMRFGDDRDPVKTADALASLGADQRILLGSVLGEPPDDDPGESNGPALDSFEAQVAHRAQRMRIDREARALLDAEAQPTPEPIDMATLREVLARPAPPRDRIEGLAPWEGSTLITAQRKTGKTTMIGNLARCLISGEQFLGRFAVKPLRGTLAILNYEVATATLARWLQDIGVNLDRVILVSLRGRSSPLRHLDQRAELATRLRGAEVEAVIVDPFGRAFTGNDQNNTGEVTAWLNDLDVFVRSEIGARDLFLTNHAGWNAERSRGNSALEDWPDALWRIVKPQGSDDEDDDVRYFSAFGRDVDVAEDALEFDPQTRRLSLTGNGGRHQASSAIRDAKTERDILRVLADHPNGLSGNQLYEALGKRPETKAVRDGLVARGLLAASPRPGRGGGTCFRLPNPELTEGTRNLPNRVPSEPTRTSLYREGGSSSVIKFGEPTRSGEDRPIASSDEVGSTCVVCGQQMIISEPGQTTHPSCEPDQPNRRNGNEGGDRDR